MQHKWSRQHKNLLASVDVKNPQANFNDLENSVPPLKSKDDLLEQAWDDHMRESWDAKKVKEARQLETEYYNKLHVFDEVPIRSMVGQDRQSALESKMPNSSKDQTAKSGLQLRQLRRCEHLFHAP